ncbi:MAG: glycosyltransferase family 39 protein [Candidatus Korobacteraceae bacterium]
MQDTSLGEIEAAPSYTLLSFVAAGALGVFYLASSLYIASHRLLWFDEVMTVHMARLPDWKTLFSALGHGVDSLPPAYYMVVGIFGKVFGNSEVAVRLPSTLAMVATLLITFDCARRLSDGLHGLIALALAAIPLAGEGFEARSYAIYVMFAALALWAWACTRDSGKWSATLFGTVLFLGVSFHYYAVLLLVPFALWELSRWQPWQPISPKLIAGTIGIVLPALLLSPLILSFSRQFSTGFWSRPSLSQLVSIYADIFVDGLLILVIVTIWIVLADRSDRPAIVPAMLPGEGIGWLFLAIPLAGFVAAELKTDAFAVRYFLGLVPGVAVACACCLARNFRKTRRVSLGILLLLAAWGVAKQMQIALHPDSVETPGTRAALAAEPRLTNDGKRFFVFSDPFQFLEVQYYSKHPDECILLLPPDFERQANPIRSAPDPYIHQRVELLLSQYYPLKFWRMDQLRDHANEAALIKPAPELVDNLRRDEFDVSTRLSKPISVMYLQQESTRTTPVP